MKVINDMVVIILVVFCAFAAYKFENSDHRKVPAHKEKLRTASGTEKNGVPLVFSSNTFFSTR